MYTGGNSGEGHKGSLADDTEIVMDAGNSERISHGSWVEVKGEVKKSLEVHCLTMGSNSHFFSETNPLTSKKSSDHWQVEQAEKLQL
jgi:hypothetical protein